MLLWLAASAVGQTCDLMSDGVSTTHLTCVDAAEWSVRCTLPAKLTGKLRARLFVPDRRIEAEAPLTLSAPSEGELVFAIAGPSGRAGAFLVNRSGSGLLPGQAVGPMQLCPVVQPDVKPGSSPALVPFEVRLTVHEQSGFAEEQLDGGVVNRVPVYGPGRAVASAQGVMEQVPVRNIPIFAGGLPTPRNENLAGTLKLRNESSWHEVTWTGSLRDVPVETGDVSVLVVDFGRAELRRASGGASEIQFLQGDILAWMQGDFSSLLGVAVWSRSTLRVPVRAVPVFEKDPRSRGTRAQTHNLEIRVTPRGDRVRVLIARRAAPFDVLARNAVNTAAQAD